MSYSRYRQVESSDANAVKLSETQERAIEKKIRQFLIYRARWPKEDIDQFIQLLQGGASFLNERVLFQSMLDRLSASSLLDEVYELIMTFNGCRGVVQTESRIGRLVKRGKSAWKSLVGSTR